jgi:Fe-Mn family superoxide dismutase
MTATSLNRRSFIASAVGTATLAWVGRGTAAEEAGFTLPKLPYAYDALEPHIDAVTMETHHGKHHKTYVDNLNKALAGTDWLKKPIDEVVRHLDQVPEKVRTAVRNNGGGHFNHVFFWDIMTSEKTSGKPEGALADAITAGFTDLAGLMGQFKEAALTQFGSGWAWLVVSDKKLKVVKTPNQDNPLMDKSGTPILGIDVWEHAYYLKYKTLRASYVDAWFKVVNWTKVSEKYAFALKG